MTVERTSVYSGPYIANGVTTTFPFTFQAASVDEVTVEIDGSEVGASAFTVALNPDGTGSVLFFSPPASGQVFVYSNVLFTQEVNFENQGPFYQASVNEPIDRSALRDLWLRARLAIVSGTQFLFPGYRANKFLAWDADGNPYPASGTGADAGLRADLGSASGAALTSTADGISVQAALNLRPIRVTSRAAMKALNVNRFALVHLDDATTPGRSGWFVLRSGVAPSDPLEGLYAVSTNNSSYYWSRVWGGNFAKLEWFGGKAEDASFDNAPVIQAMHDLGVNAEGGPGRYYMGTGAPGFGTVLVSVTKSGWQLRGSNATQAAVFAGKLRALPSTEFVIRSASASGFRIGFASDPGGAGTTNWTEGVCFRDFMIRRDVDSYPLGNPATGIANAPCGIIMKYAEVCTMERVYTAEHSFGIYLAATVACRFIQTRHLRYKSAADLGNDFFAGFYQDNTLPTPFASGNASVFYYDVGIFSNMAAGNSYTYNAGIQIRGGFTDTIIRDPETANCGYGVDAQGRTSTALDYHTQDFSVEGGTFDGCRWSAVRIGIAGPRTSVRIHNNYCQVSNATGPVSYAIHLDNCQGAQSIVGNEILANPGNPAIGIYAVNSSGFTSKANIISDLSRPVVLENCVGFDMEDEAVCTIVAPATAAVETTNCQVGYLRPLVKRNLLSLTIPKGVVMNGTANRRIEVNCSGINSDSLAGGAASKLFSNGASVGTAGAFNTDCLASGVMA